jgi:hypothetical protein
MSVLPELSASTKRSLAIKWDMVLETVGLTEEQVAACDQDWKHSLRVSDDLVNRFAEREVIVRGRRRFEFADVKMVQSLVVAEDWFQNLEHEYFAIWTDSGSVWELYKTWLAAIELLVLVAVESIWKRHPEPLTVWYETVCKPALEKLLSKLVKESIDRARLAEVRALMSGPKLADDPAPGRGEAMKTQSVAASSAEQLAAIRRAFATPRLADKGGWSPLDWAKAARVDFHTVNDYLKGITRPFDSTLKKLADALGVKFEDLPK